jgi:hypothetical protein
MNRKGNRGVFGKNTLRSEHSGWLVDSWGLWHNESFDSGHRLERLNLRRG